MFRERRKRYADFFMHFVYCNYELKDFVVIIKVSLKKRIVVLSWGKSWQKCWFIFLLFFYFVLFFNIFSSIGRFVSHLKKKSQSLYILCQNVFVNTSDYTTNDMYIAFLYFSVILYFLGNWKESVSFFLIRFFFLW